jgi:TolB-like protein/class 3 adenylate cyclase/cytochrome c-type biogenesis protein CcmH/NrfG
MERRLAAILAADMVGYSRLMAADETGTLARQNAHRKELIDPRIAEYGGRVVKSTGDGVLVEFPSVVDALCCAVTIQLAMPEREAASPEENRIAYRIGINLGDIIIEDDDIYGDGVNVAARLEALAEPGGICVSRTVVDHVRGKVTSDFEDLGEQQVKNIPEPVHVFRVLMQPEAARKSASESRRMAWWRSPAAGMVGVVAVLAIAAVGIMVWRPWAPDVEPASVERMAFALPDKPSLAVLPFDNMSGDPEQEYFADGMTEDLITDLSKISGLFVIARNSTFTYKGTPVEVRQVAEDLGVRYVLEGSVRRAGDEVRINAQLIDATTGGHVWAERYDGSVVDIFSVQDEFVRKIVKALAVNLSEDEQEEIALGQTSNIEAREAFQKGWESYLRYSPDDNAEAVGQFKTALELDPEYGRAYAAVSLAYLRGCQLRWYEPLGMSNAEANARAQLNLEKTKSHPSSLAHVAGSGINLYNNRHEKAVTEATRAIAQDPNDPEAYIAMAWAMITTGKAGPGLELVERAMRLNPTYPNYYVLARGAAYFAMDDLEKAADVLGKALERDPGATELAPALAATYAHLGKREEARAALLLWKPGTSEQELQRIRFECHFPYEWSDDRITQNRLFDGLDIAALPLETTVSSLAEVLKQGKSSDHIQALQTLRLFGPNAVEAVPALIDALADERPSVRAQASTILGNIGPAAEAAVPALTAMQEEGFVAAAVTKSLKKITGE